jgi:tetratricopeptide (TPR) repeat protein
MRWLSLFFVLFLSFTLQAQSASKADELFTRKDYIQAAQMYADLLKKRPSDALYNYRYARCSYELNDYKSAVVHFLKSGSRYPLRDYYLADSYFQLYQFDNAIRYFTAYVGSSTANQAFVTEVEDKLRRAAIGARLINRVEDIAITDSLIVNKKDFLSYFELSKETGTLVQNHIHSDRFGWTDLISFTTQRADRKIFSDTTNHSLNLFSANKLLDGWSKTELLSSQVNSGANENYPFLMLDGLTLYFASDSDGSMGGYDIFVTRFSGVSNDYLNPDNVGMPFNSLANDYMLVIDELNHAGWFVSDRFQPLDKVVVYRFEYDGDKTYLNNDSTDAFFDRALLRTINWTEQSPVKKRRAVELVQPTDKPDFEFRITDQLVYTRSEQFRSPQALLMLNEWSKLSNEMEQLDEKLKTLRHAYSTAGGDLERVGWSAELQQLERDVMQLKRQLISYEKNIRNEEIKFLKNKDVL